MGDVLFYVVVLACFAVVLVLVTGLGGFAKGEGLGGQEFKQTHAL